MIDHVPRNKGGLHGATGLILILLTSLVTFGSKSMVIHALFAVWLCFILILVQRAYRGWILLLLYGVVAGWIQWIVPLGIRFPSPLFLMMVYKFSLLAMSGAILAHIPTGKVIAVLRKVGLPQSIFLTVVVLIRFIPTFRRESKDVKDAMKVRGIMGSFRGWLHPLKTLECFVVPIIFRALKLSDELASSAMVRGVESPYPKASYYDEKMGKMDLLLLSLTLLGIVLICIL